MVRLSVFTFSLLFVSGAWASDGCYERKARASIDATFGNGGGDFGANPCIEREQQLIEEWNKQKEREQVTGSGTDKSPDDKKNTADTKDPKKEAQQDKPLTDDQKVTSQQRALAETCQSQANSASNTCDQAVSTMNQAKSEFDRLSSQINSMSNSNPAGACQEVANVANRSANSIQSARTSCQSAAGTCQRSCADAVTSLSSLPGSQAYASAKSGQSTCSNANGKLAGVDVALGQMQSTAGQAHRCVADSTGSENGPQVGLNQAGSQNAQRLTSEMNSASGGSLQMGGSDSDAGVRRTSDLVGGTSSGGQASPSGEDLRLGEESQKDPYQASQRRLMTATGSQARPLGSSSPVGSSGNEKMVLGSRDGQSGDKLRYGSAGDYSGSGTRFRLQGSMNTPEQYPQARGGRQVAAKSDETVDLRRFQPDMQSRGQVGGPHMNIFRTINKRFDRLSGTFDVPAPGT